MNNNNIGFDLVIGNPPYIQIKTLKENNHLLEKQNYSTYNKSTDIYCLFYEKSIKIIKYEGITNLITSNKWLKSNYGLSLKNYINENTNPIILIDFNNVNLFKNVSVNVNILTLQKLTNKKNLKATIIDNEIYKKCKPDFNNVNSPSRENKIQSKQLRNVNSISEYVNSNFININTTNSWSVINNVEEILKEKIEQKTTKLKNLNVSISRGIMSGLNSVFIITEKQRKDFIDNNPNTEQIIKSILRGKDLKPYKHNFQNKYIIYLTPKNIPNEDYLKDNYPNVYNYLVENKSSLEKRTDATTKYQWFMLQRYSTNFNRPKIIFSEISNIPKFYYDLDNYYVDCSALIIKGVNLKFLTVLFNTKILTAIFKKFYSSTKLNGNALRYKKDYLMELPIPLISEEDVRYYENLDIENINLQKEEERIVRLYNLTKEDVDVMFK